MKHKENKLIRINKFISNSGICSRREADKLILAGRVYLNNEKIKKLGIKLSKNDIVQVDGKIIKEEKKEYLLLNKPKDFITTTKDTKKRKIVQDLIKGATNKRLYPVGRLDRNTTGLLLFTNDGELSKKLTHPSFKIKKIYQVELNKSLKVKDLNSIKNGIYLEEEKIEVDNIVILDNTKKNIGIEIHIGKNRIVRRIFEYFKYNIKKLDRVMIGPLTKKNLKRGKWRFLNSLEVRLLKQIS